MNSRGLCGAPADAPPEAFQAAEERWGGGAAAKGAKRSKQAVRLFGELRAAVAAAAAAPGEGEPVPQLDGHWLAARLAREAADVSMQRGDYAAASAAARWPWRFARRALAGGLSRMAAFLLLFKYIVFLL